MPVSPADRQVLRELARQVADIAALPVQRETIAGWRALNGLKPIRPMVMIDQLPWHEMNVNDELTLRTQGDFARNLETQLRRTLYRWHHMPADFVVEPFVTLGKVFHDDGFGLTTEDEIAVGDPQNDVRGHYYIDHLKTDDDLAKIRRPNVTLNQTATDERENTAREVFDGILDVYMHGHEAWFRPWDMITQWHGVEATLWDLADRPDFLHRLMQKLTAAQFALLDHLEANGYLPTRMSYIHCTGAWADSLPAPAFNPHKPRAKDNWTASMAQIFSTVSPAMHDEFEIQYSIPWYKRFGLGYYGCCEPLDKKIDVIRKLPNVRKVSMSPWVDVETGAAGLGRDYVFSRKPTPALLAGDAFDPAAVEKDLREVLDACRRHGCPVEFILKDISTVRYDPKRLWQWAELAQRLVRE